MMKFPTYEEWGKIVAEKALDEYLINEKSLREWIKYISEKEVEIGHWIGKNKDGDWYCSKCGAILEKDEQVRHIWNYCYHCGILML